MAGLLAARVLSGSHEVQILERDDLEGDRRPGVPQGMHTHILLLGGLKRLERYFPGIREELVAAGGQPLDYGRDFKIYGPYGWVIRPSARLEGVHTRRPVLEAVVRRRVQALPGVKIVTGCRVSGLAGSASRISGVRVNTKELPADIVVDASGRSSKFPEWLQALGVPPPRHDKVDARVGYASRFFEVPAGTRDWTALYVFPVPWLDGRAGSIFPAGPGLWHVGLTGAAGDYPPNDEEAWMAFARSLRTPDFYDAIRAAKPCSPIHGYRWTANERRLPGPRDPWPESFLVMGDAGCHANPVYGQGMTLASLQAEALERVLAEGVEGLPRRYHTAATKAIEPAWSIATSSDWQVRGCEGTVKPAGLPVVHRFMRALMKLAASDVRTAGTFFEVMHMVKPQTALLHPRILLRAGATAAGLALRDGKKTM